jgi:D-alanine-D-alanine ligase
MKPTRDSRSDFRQAALPAVEQIREEPREDDVAAIRRIVESTGYFHPPEVEVAVELIVERLQKGLASGYHFVFIERDGRTIAYACYGPIACTAGSFDLYWIAVERDAQRGGLGRRLLAACEDRIAALSGRLIYIETSGRPQYADTREFYVRCNYRQAAVLSDFYAPGDDKVVYVKKVG